MSKKSQFLPISYKPLGIMSRYSIPKNIHSCSLQTISKESHSSVFLGHFALDSAQIDFLHHQKTELFIEILGILFLW